MKWLDENLRFNAFVRQCFHFVRRIRTHHQLLFDICRKARVRSSEDC